MNYQVLPEYIAVEASLQDSNIAMTPAELHGLLTGFIVGQLPVTDWLNALYDFTKDGIEWDEAAKSIAQEMYEITRAEIDGEGIDIRLTLLQPEEAPLMDRAETLADWVSLFISGLGLSGIALDKAPQSVKEVMNDLSEITQLGIDEEGDMQEQESLFEQVVEHVKVCVLTCFVELNKMSAQA